jgi:hypothetical protein
MERERVYNLQKTVWSKVMRYIPAVLLFFMLVARVQAEWSWVCWERYTTIAGPRSEIGQKLSEKADGWTAVGAFGEKERCKEYVRALSRYKGQEWEKTAKILESEMFYLVPTELDNFGDQAGIVSKIRGDQWNALEWKCLPQ